MLFELWTAAEGMVTVAVFAVLDRALGIPINVVVPVRSTTEADVVESEILAIAVPPLK